MRGNATDLLVKAAVVQAFACPRAWPAGMGSCITQVCTGRAGPWRQTEREDSDVLGAMRKVLTLCTGEVTVAQQDKGKEGTQDHGIRGPGWELGTEDGGRLEMPAAGTVLWTLLGPVGLANLKVYMWPAASQFLLLAAASSWFLLSFASSFRADWNCDVFFECQLNFQLNEHLSEAESCSLTSDVVCMGAGAS